MNQDLPENGLAKKKKNPFICLHLKRQKLNNQNMLISKALVYISLDFKGYMTFMLLSKLQFEICDYYSSV